MTDLRPLLVVRHVPWEGPHRILDAFEGRPVVQVDALGADPSLPSVDEVCGAVFMGGPMSVNDTTEHPGLQAELDWIGEAIARDLPMLGVCLGSQLIARALGATIRPGARKELGWAPIEVHDPNDPLLGSLAPRQTVLHWHGEVFDVPPGATLLASSALTPAQAFRAGNAWGLLFHAEADRALIDVWLAEPTMAAEAGEVLGASSHVALRAGADTAARDLLPASRALFEAFAARTTTT